MKWQRLRVILERFSFFLWIAFTISAIAMAGLGLEGLLVAIYLVIVSSGQPVHFPLALVCIGSLGYFLSVFWRQVGIDHLHYAVYDSLSAPEDDSSTRVLTALIQAVQRSEGRSRTEARGRAKAWLTSHVSELSPENIQQAKAHFGYLLPAGWGS